MAKIVKTLTVSWQWSGDKYSLRGFNLAVTPAAKNPKEEVVATAFVETKEIKQTYSYKMGNVTLDKDAQYKIWVQAVYENSDSDWVATGGATVTDDGSATIITKTDREIQDVVNMASDNILTRQEKISLRREWQEIVYEFLEIESTAISQDIPSSNTAFSNFKSKGNALGTYLNGGTEWTISSNNKTSFPLWINDSNLGNNTSINGNTYRETFRVYYEAKVKILEEINKYKVNSVQVGGVNLLVGTATAKNTNVNAPTGYVTWDPYTTHNKQTLEQLGFKAGDKVTIGFDWSISKNGTNDYVYGNFRVEFKGIKSDGTDNQYLGVIKNPAGTFSSSNTKGRAEATVALDSATIKAHSLRFRIDNSVLNFKVSNLKMERGTKATGWSPALEEMENAYTIILTNEAQVIPTNSNRVPTSSTTYFTDIQVYKGTAQRNDYTIGTINSANGITVSKTSSRVNFAVSTNTALAADGGNFIIPITIDGKTFNKTFSWSCSKQGNTGATGNAGQDAITIVLSNENHTFPCESNGNIPTALSTTCVVTAYKGGTSVTPTIGAITNPTGMSITKNGATLTIQANTGTSLADSGTVNIPITVDGKAFNKTFTWSKAKKGATGATGATGAGAKTVDIVASSQVFKSADGGKTFLPDTITLTPTLQNVTFSKWQYSIDGGRSWSNVSSGSNGLTVSGNNLQISKSSNLFTSTNTTVVFKVITNDSAIYDTMTIVKLYDVTELEVGGRNYIRNGKGDKKAGFFKNFNAVTGGYGELTLTSQKTYSNISIADGFVLGCRDYEVGRKMVFSYDIMYTKWDFPSGTNRQEFWIGQRYTNSPTSTDGQWVAVTKHNLPVVGENGCKLNEWYHVSKIITIPKQAEATIGTAASIQFYNNADVSASFTARFKNVKLEYGNMETDWIPAPEDVATDIDNAKNEAIDSANNILITTIADYYTKEETNSQIDIAKESINLGVSSTYETKANVETKVTSTLNSAKSYADTKKNEAINSASTDATAKANNALNNAKSYADTKKNEAINAASSDATNKVNSAKNELNTAIGKKANSIDVYTKTQVYTKDETNSQINIAKDAINLGVSQTYETKANVETKVNTTLNSAKSYADTKKNEAINSAASDATSKVNSAKNELNTKIDGIQVGGRNLIKNSNKRLNGTTPTSVQLGGVVDYQKLKGKTVTLSMDINVSGMTNVNGQNNRVGFEFSMTHTDDTTSYIGLWHNVSDGNYNGRKTKTLTIPNKDIKSLGYTGLYIQCNATSCDMGNVKLEEGNKATSWTPAPEDVNSNIDDVKNSLNSFQNTVNTSFKDGIVEQAEAKAIAQHLKTLDAEKADIDKEYSTIYSNANLTGSAKTNLASAKTSFDSAHTSLKSTINTVISDGRVSSSESASVTSTFGTYNTQLGVYKQRVQEALDNISSGKIDGVQVGGCNLYKNTKNVKQSDWGNGSSWSLVTLDNGFVAFSRGSTWNGLYQNISYETGETYTLSAYVRGSGGAKLNFYYNGSGSTQKTSFGGNDKYIAPETWTRVWATFKVVGSDFSRPRFENPQNGGTLQLYAIKMEKGNKATDWSPAPEDVASDITNAKNEAINSANNTLTTTIANYYTKEQTNSQINIAKEAINLGVSNTYETKADVETKINGIQIGGTNLVLNSHFNYDRVWGKSKGVSWVQEGFDGGYCMKTVGALKETRNFGQNISINKLEKGQQYTATVWLKTQDVVRGTTNPHLYLYASYSLNGQYVTECALSKAIPNGTTAWTKYVLTFTTPTVNFDVMRVDGYGRDFTGIIWWDGIKLEKGNKASDWSPAPEDISTDITNAKTDAINTASTDAANKVNSAKNELNTAIGKKANSIDVYTKSEVYTKAQTDSQIKIARDEINLGVSNTYETKANVETKVSSTLNSAKSYADTKKNEAISSASSDATNKANNALNNAKSYADTKKTEAINSAASDAASKVNSAKNELNKKIDNIQVGGRNLVNGTAEPFVVTHTELNKGTSKRLPLSSYLQNNKNIIRNKYITFSIDVKTTNLVYGTTNPWVGFELSVEGNTNQWLGIGGKTIKAGTSDGFVRYVSTTKVNDMDITGLSLQTLVRDCTGTVELVRWQIEIGSKASDWTPSPEDVNSAIDKKANSADVYTKTQVYTKEETNSQIKVAKDEINLGVSNTYETKTNVETKINAIQVGSRNWVQNSAFESTTGWVTSSGWSVNSSEKFRNNNSMYISRSGLTSDSWSELRSNKIDVKQGDKLVGSWYIKHRDCDMNSIVELWGYKADGSGRVSVANSYQLYGTNANWTRYVLKGTVPANVDYVQLAISHRRNGIIYAAMPQVEYGNTATDWSPAPEDIENEITILESETKTLKESVSSLQLNSDSINASVKSLQETVTNTTNGLASDISSIQNQVNLAMTANDVKLEIQKEMAKGTNKVTTATGFTFNESGLNISKSDSEMSTRITEDGMKVYRNNDVVLTANNQGVDAKNLHATTYLIIGGNSRVESITEDGTKRTAVFWIGS